MLKFIKNGLMRKGVLTKEYPTERFEPYEAFFSIPVIDACKCEWCGRCASVCPTESIALVPEGIEVSLESCVFCSACADACPSAIKMGKEFELAAKRKDDLKVVYKRG